MIGNRDELLCRLDLDAKIVEANDTFCAFFGRAQSELVDLPFAELFAHHDRAPIGAHLAQLRAGSYPEPREQFLSAASGTRHLIQWIDYPMTNGSGEVTGLQTVGRDITDQRGEEWRELCQIRERLELGLRGTNDGLWDWNIATGEVYYSPRFLEILSVDKPSFLPEIESIFARLHPEDMSRMQHEIDYHLVEREPYASEFRLLNGKGEYIWVLSRAQAVWDSHGRPVRMVGSISNITGRKETEVELLVSQERFRLLFEESNLGLAMTDLGGGMVHMNRAFLDLVGLSAAEVPNLTLWDVTPSEYRDVERRALNAPEEAMTYGPWEKEIVHTSGSRTPVIQNGVEVEDSDGRGYIWWTLEDITERKRVDRIKNEFLANMSHEIRTPLAAIHGFLDILDGPSSSADRESAVATIRRNAEHLLVIIDDLLDLSKIEEGSLEIERRPFDPGEILNEVVGIYRPTAEGKNLTLDLTYHNPIPTRIENDALRYRQVLMNLVGNAVKFTDSGRVRVEVELDDAQGEPSLQVDIVDTGIGISEEKQESCFRPFSQVDGSLTRKHGGTGLGLALCQRLAAMLGGETTLVTSTPREGSRFRVRIATGPIADVPRQSEPDPDQHSRGADEHVDAPLEVRILLAEDGPDNQRLISHLLRKVGAEVEVVENGKLAVEAAFTAEKSGEPFDLVLMDMQMPELDGYGATQILRKAGFAQPIIAVTAHALAGDREKCLDAGCDDYLTKPVNKGRLIDICRKHLESTQA